MTDSYVWMLPEAVDEALPAMAWRYEALRRRLLDLYRGWGYDLIRPPFVEHVEALRAGVGKDLERQIVKLVDPLSGRLLGLRADMTPQAARIDAHRLQHDAPTRLCYIGSVFRAEPDGPGAMRNPLQFGCELFGHSGIESDQEVASLLVESILASGVESFTLDLGHVGIYHRLASHAGLDQKQERRLFELLQGKASTDVAEWLAAGCSAGLRDALAGLINLNGGVEVLDSARRQLSSFDPAIGQALDDMHVLADFLSARYPSVNLHFDLAELSGYTYQNGIVFAAYVPGCGQAVARGGRYDGVGEAFGRSRPATGFSADLKLLAEVVPGQNKPSNGILAPKEAAEEIQRLRAAGERVIVALPGSEAAAESLDCDRELKHQDGEWIVELNSTDGTDHG